MNFKIRNHNDKEAVKSYVDKLPDGKQFDVSIKKKRTLRSYPQNSLYWLWLSCISAETGNDKAFLHEYFKEQYLPKDQRVIFGHNVEISISTTALDTAQFTSYLERIKQFASSELGIILPNPEDLQWQQFYETYRDFI